MRAPTAPAADADPFLDFPADDSGAIDHVVEPVLCDDYEAFLDSFNRLVSSSWPKAYA